LGKDKLLNIYPLEGRMMTFKSLKRASCMHNRQVSAGVEYAYTHHKRAMSDKEAETITETVTETAGVGAH
jgi:hypothetical protein